MSNEIAYIPDHADLAEARLPQQYMGKAKLTALARLLGSQVQDVEDIVFDMIDNGGILDGYDSLLDQIGDVVGQLRQGLSDADYKLRLIAKIGQNVSDGTTETLIRIFKILMQADKVYFNEIFPAGFSLEAINATPLGSIDEIKAALNASRLGGVGIDFFATAPTVAFSFSDDPDLNGEGFGDSTDASVGGTLAQVI